MGITEGLIGAGVVVGVFVGIGYIIFAKAAKRNPKLLDLIDKIKPGSLYEKVEPLELNDKIEQVWDERRAVM